jgi:hypothetical protein
LNGYAKCWMLYYPERMFVADANARVRIPPVQRAYPLGGREPLVGVWLDRRPLLARPSGDPRPGGEMQLAQDLGDVVLYGALREVGRVVATPRTKGKKGEVGLRVMLTGGGLDEVCLERRGELPGNARRS